MRGDPTVQIAEQVISDIDSSILEITDGYSDAEDRDYFYWWAIQLIEEGKDISSKEWWLTEPVIQALLLIQYTWNARGMFRREGKLGYEDMECLLQQVSDMDWFVDKDRLTSFDFEAEGSRLGEVYADFCDDYPEVDGLGDVGASKVLHLLNPELIVMWDSEIREGWSLIEQTGNLAKSSGSPINFVRFQRAMKQIAVELENDDNFLEQINNSGKTTAKVIDEYNYRRFTK